jgi:TonB family protein
VRVVESGFPGGLAEELAETVVRTLPPLAEPAEEGDDPPSPLFRLYVEAGDDAVLSVGPATACRPRLLNGSEVQSLLSPLGPRFPAGGRIVVDLLIDEDGTVGDYSIREGVSDLALEAALVSVLRQMRFRPAQVDGHPWAAWIRMPFQLQVRE